MFLDAALQFHEELVFDASSLASYLHSEKERAKQKLKRALEKIQELDSPPNSID